MRKIVMASALALTVLTASASSLLGSPLFNTPGTQVPAHRGLPIVLAQATDSEVRIQQLEEQLRQMNGRIEEMSFQLLQMQENMRKAQEDYEFRFQDLEKHKKSSALEPAPGTQTNDVANASGDQTPEASPDLDQPLDQATTTDDMAAVDPTSGEDPAQGQPATDLGSIKFDENGNVIGADADTAINPANPADPVEKIIEGTNEVATATQDTGYQAAYEHMLSGDYAAAEEQFRAYIGQNPEGAKIADANFWMGEAQYSQAKYAESAKTFLKAYKTYGKSEKAPEMLLKLAMSLAALDSRDTACATLREVSKTYPKASRAIVSKVASEQKRLSC